MRRQTHIEKAQEHFRTRVDAEQRLKMRKAYEVGKEAYNNSKEGLFEKKMRAIVQETSKAEQDAYRLIVQAMEVLRDETFELIKNYLEEENENVSKLPLASIENALNQSYLAVGKLKKMCATEEYKSQLNPKHPSEYEKLFNLLMDKLDIRFALYAPARSLNRKTIKFNRLSEDLKDVMFERLERFGLTENEEYLEAYENIFENQITGKGAQL